MLARRAFLFGSAAAVLLAGRAQSQTDPKLFVLPKGVTSPQLHLEEGGLKPRFEMSLEGWLVVNGAAAPRATYRELCDMLGDSFGESDGASCRLPKLPVQYDESGQPISGFAISPFWFGEMPPGGLKPFDVRNNL